MDYLLYRGYPINYAETETADIKGNLIEIIDKVIDTDIRKIKTLSDENKTNANSLIKYLALQSSYDTSMNKISNYLDTSNNIILNSLEKTQIIFHCEAYASTSKRNNKSWKYYFATSSLKHALISTIGNTGKIMSQHEGIILENMVASKLHQLLCRIRI